MNPDTVRLTAVWFLAALLFSPCAHADETDPPAQDEPVAEAEADAEDLPVADLPVADLPVEDLELGPVEELGAVFVTATRQEVLEAIVPRSVNIVTGERVLERSVPSTVDVLDDQIGLWVEKRTAHTSDLVIRGLSGGNLLALVDGNTLSTFWGEGGFAGDDMYGKVDPEMIERIEVVRGPASVLYGSNALGGVVNFITKSSPFDYSVGRNRYGGRTRILGGSAPELFRIHQEFYGATETLRWIVGGTYWNASSTRDGSGEIQSPTGGDGVYANAQLNFKLNETNTFNLTAQLTENFNAYRFYRPTQQNSNHRLAIAAWWELDGLDRCTTWADSARITLYLQQKKDTRRWYDAVTGAVTKNGVATWDTLQAGAQFSKQLCRHDLTYGVSLESTWGESPDDEQFTVTPIGGSPMKAAPDSVWSSAAIYIQDVWEARECLLITASLRAELFRIATTVDDQYVPPGGLDPSVDEFTDYQPAFVGGLQATWILNERTNLFGGWTRGFRQFAPHFGATQHGFGIVVPSQLLEPVTADQFEVGLKHRSRYFSADAAAYYTKFRNWQNVIRGTFQGQDWFDYNQDTIRDPGEDVYVTVGNGNAYVYGFELWGEMNLAALSCRTFGEHWSLGGGFMWNYGQDETNDIPFRHTHPARGLVRLRYENLDSCRKPWVELAADIVGEYRRIPPSRLANDVGYFEDPQDGSLGKRRPWGLPAYTTVDLRGGIDLSRKVRLVAGLNNVFDVLYRPAHARWDAPGRNVYVTIDAEF